MTFEQEETGYAKTAISDLQGAWQVLRDQVVEEFGFEGSDEIIELIENVRDDYDGALEAIAEGKAF
jgi:hypothetical protein